MVEDSDVEELRAAGWGEKGIYEATALISFFNYSGRMDAASGYRWIRCQENHLFPKLRLVNQP
jgi:hypothetical protein